MLYVGQTHTVAVPLPVKLAGQSTGVTIDVIRTAFEARYREAYGRLLDGIAIRLLNLRVAAIGRRPKFDLSLLAPAADADIERARRGGRNVYVDGAWHEAAVYERLALPAGARVEGPALLEQPDATIFVEPDLVGEVDRFGNFIISRR
jgi:N-methylhydantoinase A